MNIVLTESEKHPAEQSAFPRAEEDKDVLFVFGMHRLRGDNKIYLSETNAGVITFLNGKGLSLLDPAQPEQFERANGTVGMMHTRGYDHIVSCGVSYNVRKTWTAEQYVELLEGIKGALNS